MQSKYSLSFRIVEFIFRIVGGVGFSLAGIRFADWSLNLLGSPKPDELVVARIAFFLVGGLAGFILTPYFTTRPTRVIRRKLGHLAAETLFAGLIGLVVGLLVAALLLFPLSLLPAPFGQVLPEQCRSV